MVERREYLAARLISVCEPSGFNKGLGGVPRDQLSVVSPGDFDNSLSDRPVREVDRIDISVTRNVFAVKLENSLQSLCILCPIGGLTLRFGLSL